MENGAGKALEELSNKELSKILFACYQLIEETDKVKDKDDIPLNTMVKARIVNILNILQNRFLTEAREQINKSLDILNNKEHNEQHSEDK